MFKVDGFGFILAALWVLFGLVVCVKEIKKQDKQRLLNFEYYLSKGWVIDDGTTEAFRSLSVAQVQDYFKRDGSFHLFIEQDDLGSDSYTAVLQRVVVVIERKYQEIGKNIFKASLDLSSNEKIFTNFVSLVRDNYLQVCFYLEKTPIPELEKDFLEYKNAYKNLL